MDRWMRVTYGTVAEAHPGTKIRLIFPAEPRLGQERRKSSGRTEQGKRYADNDAALNHSAAPG
jgi:hypothetical protein